MITQQRLKELLHYDPLTGEFTWIQNRRNKNRIGDKAGRESKGYFEIGIDKKKFLSHRMAFLFMTGEIPDFVDHINGNRSDNRWCNLRPATRAQNMHNTALQKNNTSGFKGVTYSKTDGKWKASVGHDNKKYSLGSFDTAEKASEAANKLREKLHGDFVNNGSWRPHDQQR